MTSILKFSLVLLILSSFALAQSAPKKSQANPPKPQAAATTPAASENGKGQKDAAVKASGSHSGNMIGNHKDVMGVAADKNQGSGSHSGNMTGNHKDVMESVAPNPSTSGKTQPASGSQPATGPAAQPTPAPSKPVPSEPNSSR
jgi:hypothetical protein